MSCRELLKFDSLLQEQKQQQRQASEAVIKKAPWSAVSAQAQQATSQEGPTLAEIQRLEREKKLEQMKEQQQMMQAIAQQQAAALAREHVRIKPYSVVHTSRYPSKRVYSGWFIVVKSPKKLLATSF